MSSRSALIVLTATISLTLGLRAAEPEQPPGGFLFVTFKGEQNPLGEQIHFALSRDGRDWTALNHGDPVLVSNLGEKGARDPCLLRSHDGKRFFLIATDLSINLTRGDWKRAVRAGSRSLLVWESPDLVNWSASRLVKVAPDDAGCAWAPEAVYDEENGDYLVFWASTSRRDNFAKHRIWAARTKDFVTFGQPFVFIDKPTTVIDATIVRDGNAYYRFTKDEKRKAITLETAARLAGPWSDVPGFNLGELIGYEGPAIYRLEPARGGRPATWGLILDHYAKSQGYQPWTTADLATGRFEPAQGFKFPFKFRHGSVLPVTGEEFTRLSRRFGDPRAASVQSVPPAVTAHAAVRRNPVLPGYYADPDVLWSARTGRYYLYPTTDGFPGWGATAFKAFSSADLVDWKDEGVVLDLARDVAWAGRNAWAPGVIERRTPSGYRYYFYFTAEKKIGVAVGEHPAGPFRDSGRPLIDSRPPGAAGGLEIDPAVFHDPVSGKYYLYWGNAYMAAAELSDDMLSIKPETLRVITPDKTFREGTAVFFRNGVYYILWSEGDTGSPDYRVRYATAKAPLGPLVIPENNIVIEKDPAAGIYGTGHNSILRIPGRDEWYVVYHRFNYPNGLAMGRDAGFRREVCIDRLTFDAGGAIIPVKPTRDGT